MSPVLFSLLLSPVILGQRSRYLYIDDIALMATRALPEESLKNAKTEANTLTIKIRWLGLKVKPLKTKAMVYHRTRTESPIEKKMVVAGYIVKTS